MNEFDILGYDRYPVAFSGGKDSIALFLSLLEHGVPIEKIELHHHLVDGQDGNLFDWPGTKDYCRKFAKHFGVPIYFSWLKGGIEGEMCRHEERKKPSVFESISGELVTVGGDRGKISTRQKFPARTANLRTRWCSAYAKISVMDAVLINEDRFKYGKTLVLTGERAEESKARENYAFFEPHRADNRDGKRVKRYIDVCRLVHQMTREEVWALIEKYKVVVPPPYHLGFGRLSCAICIFSSANQLATIKHLFPEKINAICAYEKLFAFSWHDKKSIGEVAASGTVYQATLDKPETAFLSQSSQYYGEIVTRNWELPAGAYGEQNGSI